MITIASAGTIIVVAVVVAIAVAIGAITVWLVFGTLGTERRGRRLERRRER